MATAVAVQPLQRSSSPFRPFSAASSSQPSVTHKPPVKLAPSSFSVTPAAPVVKETSAACPHLSHAMQLQRKTAESYALAVRWGKKREADALRGRQTAAKCASCGQCPARPAICLVCGDVFCTSGLHARRHLLDARHLFYVDVKTGAIFCGGCNDHVSHPLLSATAACSGAASEELDPKRRRIDYKGWRPNAESKVLVAQSAKVRSCDGEGIRGIRNLGATCFINVVLQALLHNPLFRGYFLGDRHNAASCPIANSAEGGVCMSCEVDKVFSEVLTDAANGTPYGPVSMLQASWLSFKDLAGYSQQDAHEYFISTLDAIHRTSAGTSNSADCHCIVHTTFAGELRSEVKCAKCGHTTTAMDPFLDLSLDIRAPLTVADVAGAEQASTLFSCLDRYTSTEKLGKQLYTCQTCGSEASDATKTLSINRLPPVLCIQLKRFEHAAGSRKIDTRVRFPYRLDMAPYTATKYSNDSTYELFAVVTHEGKLDTGHYYIHARRRDNWTLINDETVTPASLASVLATNPYLLFYARSSLGYASRNA